MVNDRLFALVVAVRRPDLLPHSPKEFGICLVDGEKCSTMFVDAAGIDSAIAGYPCVPSRYGSIPGVVSFEAEMQALDAVIEAGADLQNKYRRSDPPGFTRLCELQSDECRIDVVNGRLTFHISPIAMQIMGWKEGDFAQVAISRERDSLAIYLSEGGSPLCGNQMDGWITVERDWRIPPSIDLIDGSYAISSSIRDEFLEAFLPERAKAASSSPPQSPESVRELGIERFLRYDFLLLSLATIVLALTAALIFEIVGCK